MVPWVAGTKSHPKRLEERETGVYNRVRFKKNCSWIQILAPWRAWKTLDLQKEKVCPRVPSSHPVWGRDVRDTNTHGIFQAHH